MTNIINTIEIKLSQILKANNVAPLLSGEEQEAVAQLVTQTFAADSTSNGPTHDMLRAIMALVMQDDIMAKKTSNDARVNAFIPIILKAATNFHDEAINSLILDGQLVKGSAVGSDKEIVKLDAEGAEEIDPQTKKPIVLVPAGVKQEKADRVATFCNYILNEHMEHWFDSFNQLLMSIPILGYMFKEAYFDEFGKEIVSDLVYPTDVFVNAAAKNLTDSPISRIQIFSQNEIYQYMTAGKFVKYEMSSLLEQPETTDKTNDTANTNDYDQTVPVIVQHRVLDLDGDGYKEPYKIFVSKVTGKLLGIFKRFQDKDIIKNEKGDLLSIKAFNYFIKFGFIPNPNGTIYDIGFGYILFNLNKQSNSALNQLLKAGIRANLQRGFVSSDLRLSAGELKLEDDDWKIVRSTPGVAIKDNIIPFDSKEPSPTLFNLLQLLITLGKETGQINDANQGLINANVQPMSLLPMIERSLQSFKSIYKVLYLSLKKEFKNILYIIREHEEIFKDLYIKVVDDSEADFTKDVLETEINIIPASDIEIVTNLEKYSKASFLTQLINNPTIQQTELMKRILTAYKIEDADKLIVQQDAVDPMSSMMQVQQMIESQKVQIAQIENARKTAEAAAKTKVQDIEIAVKDAQIEKTRAETAKILKETQITVDQAKQADQIYQPTNQARANDQTSTNYPGGVPNVAGEPDNSNISGMPKNRA